MKKTPQERLEIKEFILDANLYLISNIFYTVTLIVAFLYITIFISYSNNVFEIHTFIVISIIFIPLLLFALLGHRNIIKQKKYISRLESVFEREDDV